MECIANGSSTNLPSRIEDLEKIIENIKSNIMLMLTQNKHLKYIKSRITIMGVR